MQKKIAFTKFNLKNVRKFFFPCSVFLLMIVNAPRQSLAYIPPADFILKAFAKQHLPYVLSKQNVLFQSTLLVFGTASIPNQTFKLETLYLRDKRIFKISIKDSQGKELLSKEKKAVSAAIGPVLLFFTEHRPEVLTKYLNSHGIEIPKSKGLHKQSTNHEGQHEQEEGDSVSPSIQMITDGIKFDRVHNKVGWKIGKVNAIWIEKDTFFPLKFEYKQDDSKVNIFWDNFRFANELFYPEKTIISKNAENIFEESVDGVKFFYDEPPSKINHLNSDQTNSIDSETLKKLESFLSLYK